MPPQGYKKSNSEQRAFPAKNKKLQGEISKYESLLQEKRAEIEVKKDEDKVLSAKLKVLRNMVDRSLG